MVGLILNFGAQPARSGSPPTPALSSFKEPKNAFEGITRTLSQATLNSILLTTILRWQPPTNSNASTFTPINNGRPQTRIRFGSVICYRPDRVLHFRSSTLGTTTATSAPVQITDASFSRPHSLYRHDLELWQLR